MPLGLLSGEPPHGLQGLPSAARRAGYPLPAEHRPQQRCRPLRPPQLRGQPAGQPSTVECRSLSSRASKESGSARAAGAKATQRSRLLDVAGVTARRCSQSLDVPKPIL